MPLIARHARYRFPRARGREAVAGVTLEIAPAERVALVGPNGSGKTTLLRLLAGLLKPSAGEMLLDDAQVSRLSAAHRAGRLAYLPQSSTLAFPFDVARFVGFGRHALGRHDLEAHAAEAIAAVGLTDRAADPVGALSAGQQQRASMARALCQLAGASEHPRFLIADEPTAALDPRHETDALRLFHRLAAQGIGVVASLHDLAAASRFDRVLVLGEGGVPIALDQPEAALGPDHLEAAFGVRFDTIRDPQGTVRAMVPVG